MQGQLPMHNLLCLRHYLLLVCAQSLPACTSHQTSVANRRKMITENNTSRKHCKFAVRQMHLQEESQLLGGVLTLDTKVPLPSRLQTVPSIHQMQLISSIDHQKTNWRNRSINKTVTVFSIMWKEDFIMVVYVHNKNCRSKQIYRCNIWVNRNTYLHKGWKFQLRKRGRVAGRNMEI